MISFWMNGMPLGLQRVLECDSKADSDPMLRKQHGTACGRSADGGRDGETRLTRVESPKPVEQTCGVRRRVEQVAVEACHERDAPQYDPLGRRRDRERATDIADR